jgi:hypothetical protein
MKTVLSKMKGGKKRQENICNTAPYSDSVLSSLSSHRGADWIYSDSMLSSLSSHRGADWIYSVSMLSSLSSHRGADWIITRAPEGSLQF